MKKVTHKDVAKLAGVSPSTVSRYINRSSFIDKVKVDAIEKAIAELGYKYTKRAAINATLRSMKVGVVAASYDSPHISCILAGINKVIIQHGYELRIEITQWKTERELKLLKQFVTEKMDAIIVIGGHSSESEIKAITKNLPVLLLGTPALTNSALIATHLPQIRIDNELGGYMATNHLLQLGHRKIVHIKGPEENADANQRLLGYKRSLESAGIPFDEKLVVNGHFSLSISQNEISQLLNKGIEFSAIFAASDESAIGAMQALYQHGLAIPDDISVIGFDNLPISSFVIPPLTTIHQPFEELGEIAIQYSLDLISGNKPKYSIPIINIVVRDSTKAFSARD
jgi:LacI family transcriptional regulator